MSEKPEVLTVEELAEYFRVSIKTARRRTNTSGMSARVLRRAG